jgi:hypothetical protein
LAGHSFIQCLSKRSGISALSEGHVASRKSARSRRRSLYYEVTRPNHLEEWIFPFFDRFRLRGPKARDLEILREITELVQASRHKCAEGIEEILKLRSPMNRGGKRRRSDEEIIALLRDGNPQRPYAELLF